MILQAAFVPASESALDTSYFTSRYSWNTSDGGLVYPPSDFEDSSDADSLSGSSSCLSNRQDEMVVHLLTVLDVKCELLNINFKYFELTSYCEHVIYQEGDECGGLAEFDSSSSVNYSFSNFSFKVILKHELYTYKYK